jgi:OOP family OmpA-OmpF porin
VADGLDNCPSTPVGQRVDAVGCPLARDADADGVPDNLDRCPGTPAGTPVDQVGCVVLFRVVRTPGARPTLVLRGVNFQTGRSALTVGSYAVLDQVAASRVANPEIRIEIAGYTDNTGSAGVNTRLSNARAFAVRAYLARKGVAPSRMVARGYGPASPVATNATAAGRAQNRRVELHKPP